MAKRFILEGYEGRLDELQAWHARKKRASLGENLNKAFVILGIDDLDWHGLH